MNVIRCIVVVSILKKDGLGFISYKGEILGFFMINDSGIDQ